MPTSLDVPRPSSPSKYILTGGATKVPVPARVVKGTMIAQQYVWTIQGFHKRSVECIMKTAVILHSSTFECSGDWKHLRYACVSIPLKPLRH